MQTAVVVSRLLHWYSRNGRDLPWRRPEATAWEIMVSEYMLQQTPVERVLRPWQEWMARWPTPAALAAAPVGEAVRAWGRLGYPRRALRLHQAAVVIARDHHGRVPSSREEMLRLPGAGSYTASAILSFAYGQRHVVLDTNVRRVLARVATGANSPGAATTGSEIALAATFLPRSAARAALWGVASMELGALVCTTRSPRCLDCPLQGQCEWRRLGYPAPTGAPRRSQGYSGSDRQCRGALMAVLRASDGPVLRAELDRAWPDPDQRDRALDSLLSDGLAEAIEDEAFALPQ
jgi:A/G-specific adenine glycosylase